MVVKCQYLVIQELQKKKWKNEKWKWHLKMLPWHGFCNCFSSLEKIELMVGMLTHANIAHAKPRIQSVRKWQLFFAFMHSQTKHLRRKDTQVRTYSQAIMLFFYSCILQVHRNTNSEASFATIKSQGFVWLDSWFQSTNNCPNLLLEEKKNKS